MGILFKKSRSRMQIIFLLLYFPGFFSEMVSSDVEDRTGQGNFDSQMKLEIGYIKTKYIISCC